MGIALDWHTQVWYTEFGYFHHRTDSARQRRPRTRIGRRHSPVCYPVTSTRAPWGRGGLCVFI